MGGVLGGLASLVSGGVLRFIPEVLKIFTDGKERKHEKEMTELQLRIDENRAKLQLDAAAAASAGQQAVAEMEAYVEAMKGQSKRTGVKFIDALSASVRPVMSYWWLVLYTVIKGFTTYQAIVNFIDISTFVAEVWTAGDAAVLDLIIGFWFVDRAIRHNTGK
jgi:hypothetical protein